MPSRTIGLTLTPGSHRAKRRLVMAVLATLLPTTSPAAQSPVTTPYRLPIIALVQPASTGTVPRDKPIVVFRFAAGESDDPIDARSFTITVDGFDRSARFQVATDEAWGSLGGIAEGDSLLALGPHAVAARICSVRGACAMTSATITVDAAAVVSSPASTTGDPTQKPPSSRARMIARVLEAVRKIFVP